MNNGVNRRAVSFSRSDHPHALPVAERGLFVQPVLVPNAEFGVVLFDVGAASVRPPLLIAMREVAHAAKGRLGGIRVLVVLPVVVGFLGVVVDRIFKLPGHIIVCFVEKPDQTVDLVTGFLAEASYGLKGLFRGDRGL
jgi:hypothetical protein